ncbi:BCCT family transporter [Parvularcula oceani]|uniref:BCCT family transporter n=1 Tax=Parvularcula oceani TaxID=1247963 RepID=UPI0006904568|nr:BCCT family transporter [Parvularcula oceani]
MRLLPHALVGAGTLLIVLFPGPAALWLRQAADWFLLHFGRPILWGASACVVLCAVLAVIPAGRVRIGGQEAVPEFGTFTWLSMLFAAGMGAGLVFWGAAEPLIHAGQPPPGTEGEALHHALALTQFHWSLHAWAIYAIAALAVALSLRPGRPPLPSAPFPSLGPAKRRLLDWTALIAVLFGVVASMGQGLFQMGAGLEILTGQAVPDGRGPQVAALLLLFAAYAVSVATGLHRGIAVLSVLNVGLALLLMGFVLVTGSTGAILRTLAQTSIAYLSELPRLSLEIRPEGAGRQWTRDWSLTYFLWWVAWTPFVGVFIARISIGRTVRSFLAGVVLVPSLATLVWFSVFGGAALSAEAGGASLGVTDFATAPQASYALLGTLPFPVLSQALTLLLVFLFLVTSADSGAYVLGLFSRNGEPAIAERLYWGSVLAALTGAAIWSESGQSVTRAFAVTGAIPLSLLLAAQAGALLLFAFGSALPQRGERSGRQRQSSRPKSASRPVSRR